MIASGIVPSASRHESLNDKSKVGASGLRRLPQSATAGVFDIKCMLFDM